MTFEEADAEKRDAAEELDIIAYYLEAMDLQMRERSIDPLFWAPLRAPGEMAASIRSFLNDHEACFQKTISNEGE